MHEIINTFELANEGMNCLRNNLGDVRAEAFIAMILREQFDYTQWRHDFFDKMAPGEFAQKAFEYEEEHPYTGKAIRL